MESKYKLDVLDVLSSEKIKSTNQILRELEKKTGKRINWHVLYRILMDLEREGKVEGLKADAGFFMFSTVLLVRKILMA
jgi:DNA-binding PadR family transcriptional regulator